MKIKQIGWIIVVVMSAIPVVRAEFSLVKDGVGQAVIAIPFENNQALQAAEDLRYHLEKMSGVKFPLIVGKAPANGKLVLQVGFPANPPDGLIAPKQLPPEGFVLKRLGDTLYLYGDDTVLNPRWQNLSRNGTYSAVSYFLEKYLGCKWFMPTELGEHIPKKNTIILPDLNEQHTPVFSQRNLWINWKNPDEVKFYKRHRLGQSVIYDGGHGFEDWYERFFADHPEYFALQANDSREQPRPKQAQLCLANPEIDAIILRSFDSQLASRNELYGVSASFNDAGESFFCICNKCRKLDPPTSVLYNYYYGPNAPASKTVVKMPAMTDRYLTFVNRLARELAKTWPEKNVVYTAYRNAISAPVIEKPEKNVVVYFAGFMYLSDHGRELSRKYFTDWRKLTDKIIVRPNFLHHGAGMPLNYSRKMVEDLKFCVDAGVMGFCMDAVQGHWGSTGLHYYLAARLLENPALTYESLMEEYYAEFYGPAAAQMRDYFEELEQFTNRIAESGNSNGIQSGWGAHAPDYYTNSEIERFAGLLKIAMDATENPVIRRRIALNMEAWEYTRLLCAVLRKVRSEGYLDAARAELDQLNQWRNQHADSLSIDTERDIWRWSCCRTAAAKPAAYWDEWEKHAVLPQEY